MVDQANPAPAEPAPAKSENAKPAKAKLPKKRPLLSFADDVVDEASQDVKPNPNIRGPPPRFIPKAERERMDAEAKAKPAPAKPANAKPANVKPAQAKPPQKRNQPWANDAEAKAIRERYMGPGAAKSTFSAKNKRRKTTGNKFRFDWDPEEDTSQLRPDLPEFSAIPPRPGVDDDDTVRAWARRKAESFKKYDPETGEQRAREFLEETERNIQRNSFTRLGKHWSEKSLAEMRERDWRIFKEDFGIASKGGHIPNPMRSWAESQLPSHLLNIVASVGYKEPTPIQRAAIPIAMQARDLIGVAVTGSGKTAAFLLPLLVYIDGLPPLTEVTKNDGPYALILAPTRELVQQIESEARKFAGPMGFNVISLVGGHSLDQQAVALRNGAEIIVATPGRLVDCIERRLLVFSQCCYVIMDEADRMIDMGFEEPVNKILEALPVTNEKPDTEEAENAQLMQGYLGGKDRYRQTMMYTATMPTAVEKIARKYLRRPATVTIGNAGEAVNTIEQRVEWVSGEDRRKNRLREILQRGGFGPPIIVFVNIKANCDHIAREIQKMGFSTVTLYGSKTQDQREKALAQVRNGQVQILVATDLAGRGIDVPDVSLVVNFNMASSIEAYTHRIGRTGRAGKKGVAITFLAEEDKEVMYDLKQMLVKGGAKVPEELRRHEAAAQKPSRNGKKIET